MLKNFLYAFCLLLTFASIGCGGRLASDSPTRGEGDIPVGRVRLAPGRSAFVRIDCLSGSYTTAVNSAGIVMAPHQTPGPATITVESNSNDTLRDSFEVQFGSSQQYVFNAELQHKDPNVVVESLEVELMGSPIFVGQSRSIKIKVNGKNAANLHPTIWVEGGIGMLDSGNRLIATAAGEGTVHAELMGVEASIPITVSP